MMTFEKLAQIISFYNIEPDESPEYYRGQLELATHLLGESSEFIEELDKRVREYGECL